MSEKIGWRFPPTGGGLEHGFNDPGVAHFTGAPLASLAREVIQNSLDAGLRPEEPVHVSFELIDLDPDDIGRDELEKAIQASMDAVEFIDDKLALAAIEAAVDEIRETKILCLRVSDRNTTGLSGNQWRALVKMQGVSHKEMQGAGGSHGIGKYAPFAVSTLRTVFYWTCFRENDKDQERFQGKSILVSHRGTDGKDTQGTGFFGIKEGCHELTEDIPEPFRILDSKKIPVKGTGLWIMGFHETNDWHRRIASSVIENFFYAIEKGRLTVIVEPDSRAPKIPVQMDSETLDEWFEYLESELNFEDSALAEAKVFRDLSREQPSAEKQDDYFGHCRLYIRTGDNLSSKVGFIRKTGMLVTSQQKNLLRFPGFRDFAALCVFEDPIGNERLRRMENPKHDQFEPDRLPIRERREGNAALRRVTKWIREKIREEAGPPETEGQTVLSELAAYLPDYEPEEAFDHDGRGQKVGVGEPGFGERVTVDLKPVRRPMSSRLPPDEHADQDVDDDGDDTGYTGGGVVGDSESDGSGGGSGESRGGHGIRGGSGRRRGIPVRRVRILPIDGQDNCFRLSFIAEADSVTRLVLEEAGDSTAVPRNDVRATAKDVSLDRVPVKKGERTIIEITATEPIHDRAWRLSAIPVSEESQ